VPSGADLEECLTPRINHDPCCIPPHVREARYTDIVSSAAANISFKKRQSIRARQLHQRMVKIDDLVKPQWEQMLITVLRRSRGRIAQFPSEPFEQGMTALDSRRDPQTKICREKPHSDKKSSKIEYCAGANQLSRSAALTFFTGAELHTSRIPWIRVDWVWPQ
jgi:hypothetical protein